MNVELSFEETLQLLKIHVSHVANLKAFYDGKNVKYRLPNFPEDISENLAKHLICILESIECKREKKGGDLQTTDNRKFEVKCFSSSGPTSFGPCEKWDVIYFLDAQAFVQGNFTLYKVNLSSNNDAFQNMPINKNETFGKQCLDKRRPRLAFTAIKKHLSEHVITVFDGNIFEFYTNTRLSKALQSLNMNG